MGPNRLRAWWWHRQGLDGSIRGARPAAVLERSGWARSVAGVGPYLTLFARAGVSREAADAAVKALEIHELPSARGCTYVLPARDFALGLAVGQGDDLDLRAALKLGVTEKEIDTLYRAVLKALAGMEGLLARAVSPDRILQGRTRTLSADDPGRGPSSGVAGRVPPPCP